VAGLNALFALGYVEPPPKEAIGTLFRLVESAPVDRRMRFAGVLARARAPRHDLLPLLTRIVRDDGGVRSSSDGRYYEIATGRQSAAALLRAMGPEAAPATPALAAALKGYLDRPSITLGESRLLEACTKALGAIGPDAREALPVLETLSKDRHRWLRTIALEAMAKIRGETGGLATVPDGVELFTDLQEPFTRLSDPAAEQRRQAVLTLAGLGPRAKAARHALLGLLRDPDLEVRLLAAYALEQIDGKK
jgi:HEAT repeat protein